MQGNSIILDLDMPGYRVVSQEQQGSCIRIKVQSIASASVCSCCAHLAAKVHDRRERQLADEPLADRPVTIVLIRRRFRCLRCNLVFTEPDQIAGHRRRLTKRFRYRLFKEAKQQTIKAVSTSNGISPRTVQRAVREYAQLELSRPETPVRKLGIDEFSVRKGQRYATGLYDLERRRLLEVVEGRKSLDIQPDLEALSDSDSDKGAIQVVSMDMCGAFRSAVEEVLPDAAIVVDKYHVVAQMNDMVRDIWSRLVKGKGRKDPLRLARGLLLSKGEGLADDQRGRLWAVLKQRENGDLRRAWLLKEELRRWYRQTESKDEARAQLRAFRVMLEAEGMPAEVRQQQGMFRGWQEEMLNYFEHRVTQGAVEGKNNRIKVIQRQAYGYRNFQNLRLRLLLAC